MMRSEESIVRSFLCPPDLNRALQSPRSQAILTPTAKGSDLSQTLSTLPTRLQQILNNIIEEAFYSAVINLAGGIFQGVWKVPEFPHLILFNSPATGTTLAVSVEDLNIETIRLHIAESDLKFLGGRHEPRSNDSSQPDYCNDSAAENYIHSS